MNPACRQRALKVRIGLRIKGTLRGKYWDPDYVHLTLYKLDPRKLLDDLLEENAIEEVEWDEDADWEYDDDNPTLF